MSTIHGPTDSATNGTEDRKIRQSCQACSESKVGCDKVRPTCARCRRRGVECVYLPTKRAGRPIKKRQRQLSTAGTEDSTSPSTSHTLPPSSSVVSSSGATQADTTWRDVSMDLVKNSGILNNTPPPSLPDLATADPDLSFTPDYSAMLSNLGYDGAFDFDSFCMPLESQTTPSKTLPGNFTLEGSNDHGQGPMHLHPDGSSLPYSGSITADGINVPLAQDSIKMCSSMSSLKTSKEDGAGSSKSLPNLGLVDHASKAAKNTSFSHHEHSLHGCMTRCLCFLDELTPHGLTDTPCSTDSSDSDDSRPLTASFESVIAHARSAIDGVIEILGCPCSRNPVLLFNLALVLFRVLDWYDACTSVQDTDSIICSSSMSNDHQSAPTRSSRRSKITCIVRGPSQLTMLEYDVDADQQDDVISQIVLSRLNIVRNTSKSLSQRLLEMESENKTIPAGALLSTSVPTANHASLAQTMMNTFQRNLTQLGQKCMRKLSEG